MIDLMTTRPETNEPAPAAADNEGEGIMKRAPHRAVTLQHCRNGPACLPPVSLPLGEGGGRSFRQGEVGM